MFHKKIFGCLVVLGFLGLLVKVPVSDGATLKIGYLNLVKAFESYQKAQESEKEFQAEKEKKRDEIKKLEEKIKALKKRLETQKKALNEKEVEKRNKEITEKTAEFSRLIIEANAELREKNVQLVKQRLDEVENAIKNFARSKGYSIILRKEPEFRISPLLFAPKSMDLTEDFIKFLNKK